MDARILNLLTKFAVPAAIGVGVLQNSIYDVRGGTRAVIFDRLSGVKEGVISEGTHFLVPWLQRAIHYDVRTKPRNIATTTGSKDMQMVSLTLRVLHRPEVKALPKIYQVRVYAERERGGLVVPGEAERPRPPPRERLARHALTRFSTGARNRLRREGAAVDRQ